jgi:hypothetical protein
MKSRSPTRQPARLYFIELEYEDVYVELDSEAIPEIGELVGVELDDSKNILVEEYCGQANLGVIREVRQYQPRILYKQVSS